MKKYVKIILLICVILTIALPVFADNIENSVKAKITEIEVIEDIAKENEPTKKIQKVIVRILEGEYENEEYEMEYVISNNIEKNISNIELKEDSNILVSIEEKEGEVTNIKFIEIINQNYILYIVGIILIILLIAISRKRAMIIYLFTIALVSCIILFAIIQGWNLILVSSIISLLITIIIFISANKLSTETMIMIAKAVLGITISGILIYVLFDIMGLNNMNVKITDKLMNVKDLIVSIAILFSCGIYNAIMIAAQYIFYSNNKPYKTKSDNIIEGQRSLKL